MITGPQVMVVAAVVQAASALATVGVTVVLALITRSYARDTKRMADVMAGDREVRVAPLLDFGLGKMLQVMGWEYAKVPLAITNIGMHAATITSATLEFWSIPNGTLQSTPLPTLEGAVEPGHPKSQDVTIPLQRIPDNERPVPRAGAKRITFRVRYMVRGVTNVEVQGLSREFNL
jgi:hypothetical protein